MTNNSPNLIVAVFLTFIITLVFMVGAIYFFDPFTKKFDVSHITPEERWGDLDNVAARDEFCKSKGYVDSQIFDVYDHDRSEFAGGSVGYDIICIKYVESTERYQYSEYKKWLTSVKIDNWNKHDIER